MNKQVSDNWLYEISPKGKWVDLNFREIWQYRDLLWLFIKRDITTIYKQTVLGPFWFIIQPLTTSVTFTLIFNNVAGIETGSVPPFLFNLAGITMWGYFKSCLSLTANSLRGNAGMFSKVYFPRIIAPLSRVLSNLVKFGVQVGVFVIFYLIYISRGAEISINWTMLSFPILVMVLGLLGLSIGLIISSMTTKYRDMGLLIGFGTQLLMYMSAVMYPLEVVKQKVPEYAWLVEYNPLARIIEAFRYMTLGVGFFDWVQVAYAVMGSMLLFLIGLIVFNRAERNFIDTV